MMLGTSVLSTNPADSNVDIAEAFSRLAIRTTDRVTERIVAGLDALTHDFHKLTPQECTALAARVSSQLLFTDRSDFMRDQKGENSAPRTVYYDFADRVAYVFLKTKGGLTASCGGMRRGTRAIRIELKGTQPKVEAAFQLVSHDTKTESVIAHEVPFELRIKKYLDKKTIVKLRLQEPYLFFQYDKIKKESNKSIRKSCIIAPYQIHSLDDVMNAKLDVNRYISLLYYLLLQLKTLHEVGICHGDIKPGNILIDKNHAPKLADYDFAFIKRLGEHPVSQSIFYGTPSYTAPELLADETGPTFAADMYALGLIFYRMLYKKRLSFTQMLKDLQETKNERFIPHILAEQRKLDPFAATARMTISTTKSDNDFLESMIYLLLHSNPAKRLTAPQGVDLITQFYDV